MKIRLVGFLTKSQIVDSIAQVDKIVPEKGTVHVTKGLTFTHNFKGDKVTGVTIRRAPNFKFITEGDQEAKPEEPEVRPESKPEEPEVKESKYKIGEKVKINWEKTPYVRTSSYNDYGVVVDIIQPKGEYVYKLSRIHKGDDKYSLHFRVEFLDKYVKESDKVEVNRDFKVGDRVRVKSRSQVDKPEAAPVYTDRMDEECAGKTYTIDSIWGSIIRLKGNTWNWTKEWLEKDA